MGALFRGLGRLGRWLVGSFSWAPPPWWLSAGRLRKERPVRFWLVSLLLPLLAVGGLVGYGYWKNLPQPNLIEGRVQPPDLTPNEEGAKPRPLVIRFHFQRPPQDPEEPIPLHDRERPEVYPSVARIDQVGKDISSGLRLSPKLTGSWRWEDDRTLVFTPQQEWPAGTRFSLSMERTLFVPEARLACLDLDFETPAFAVELKDLTFYQSPRDPRVRKAVSTLIFSHPVDADSLKNHLSLTMRPSGAAPEDPAEAYPFTLTFDKNQREAYLHSEPLALPEQSNYLQLTVQPGIKPATGGHPSQAELSRQLLIPDRYSFLKVQQVRAHIVRNEKSVPQQVLTLEFTDAIDQQELKDKLTAYLLPEVNPKGQRHYWRSPREVTDAVLQRAEPVKLTQIPNERDSSQVYNFVVDLPPQRFVYLHIQPGLTSVNHFTHANLYDTVQRLPAYPRDVTIMGEGAMLSMSGSHRLSILSRGVEALQVQVGRVLPRQVHHLVSQTRGDITDPYFQNYRFDQRNLVEYVRQILPLKTGHPREANYAAFDLSPHLPKSKDQFGLFFVQVQGWDPHRNRPLHRVKDSRLVLVTDLGVLVKDNADNSHEVFVQSLAGGQPVSGAQVQLLGRNGEPLFQKMTDGEGHVRLPATGEFRDEQDPTVYLVKKGGDTSFIPFRRAARKLNLSRFAIGGVRGQHRHKDRLRAYLFTDRGIYRPGEQVQIASIVKEAPLDEVKDIPLEIAIRGPRGNEVLSRKLRLPEKGLFDVPFATEATADTGNYQAAVYLVRDEKWRGRMLGSTDFRVEEFQPDTLKIESRLLDVPQQGWSTASVLKAEVGLRNLFGTPAQGRKVTGHLRVRPTTFHFEAFKEYRFDDPYREPERPVLSVDESLPTQTSDADGLARFTMPLDRFGRGTYLLTLTTEGFEPGGGRSVRAENRIYLSPLKALVGYRPDGKLDFIHQAAERSVHFRAIAPDLSPSSLEGLQLRRVEIQTLSSLVKQPNGTYAYQSVEREREIETRAWAIPAEGAQLALPTDTPGNYQYEVLDSDGLRLARVRYRVVGQGNLTGALEKDAELSLVLDRTDYRAGETIEMQITAPYTGAGLITLESDRVHAWKWFKSQTTGSVQRIRIPESLEGNAYVTVSFVRSPDSSEIFTSPLSSAVAPFTIDRSRRTVDVSLDVDPLVRPGKPMEIGYAATRPSRLVLFAVDEGILQVAGYKAPNPLDHFLAKRALEVDTFQILDLILPEFDLLRQRSAAGGGAMMEDRAMAALAKNLNPFQRQREAPAVYWSGVVDAGPERQTLRFRIPDTFAGQLRVMAVAVAEDAMGLGQTRTLVRGPFVLTPSVLNHAAPGDTFSATVGVTNLIEGSGAQTPVEVTLEATDGLTILGEDRVRLSLDEGSEGKASFRVKVGDRLGTPNLIFRARAGDEEGHRSAGLSVRPAVPYATRLDSGFTRDGTAEVSLTRPLHDALAQQQVALDPSPLVLVEGLSDYLKHFPHGCTEQVVSQVFPLLGLLHHPLYRAQADDSRLRFSHLIAKLRERQLSDGGFSFWPGGSRVAAFPSVYVMHFLLDAEELGYPVPTDMKARGRDYLRAFGQRAAAGLEASRVRAYALYLLTRMGEVTTNQLVHLQTGLEKHQSKVWRQDLTAVYMAAAYRLLKMDREAEKLVADYRIHGAKTGGWHRYSSFHSPLTLDSQYLYLLARHFPARAKEMGAEPVLQLVEPVFRGRYNTISASYTILALAAYTENLTGTEMAEKPKATAVLEDGTETPLSLQLRPFASARFGVDVDRIRLAADQALYYLVSQAGFDRELPRKVEREGLEISREYLDRDGNPITAWTQGMDVQVRLRVRALKETADNVAVIDLLPAGFEVVRSSVPRSVHRWRADYVDIREDRVIFYGRFDTSIRELSYRARVTAAGTFVVPPAYAESMYDRSVYAGSLGGRIEVAPTP